MSTPTERSNGSHSTIPSRPRNRKHEWPRYWISGIYLILLIIVRMQGCGVLRRYYQRELGSKESSAMQLSMANINQHIHCRYSYTSSSSSASSAAETSAHS